MADRSWPPSQLWPMLRLFLVSTIVLLGVGSGLVLVLVVVLPAGAVGWVVLVVAVGGGFVAWFAWLMRWASRTASVPPRPDAGTPVTRDELAVRLEALAGTGWVHVDRVDEAVLRVTAIGATERSEEIGSSGWKRKSIQQVSRLEVALDEQACRAIVAEHTVTTSAGVTASLATIGASWQREWFRGITMPVYDPQNAPALSFDAEAGWRAHSRTGFSPTDVRSALVDVVCTSGWTYVPVFTVGRWTSAPVTAGRPSSSGGAQEPS
jgi:hypothetical protein